MVELQNLKACKCEHANKRQQSQCFPEYFLKSHRVFLETVRRYLYRNKQQQNSA